MAAQSAHAPAPDSVEAFLAALDHPRKPEILALRQVILGADPAIAEGIKWNAPSFRTSEHFATMHLRDRAGLRLILHLGAKVRKPATITIDDPHGLLTWLAADRATLLFRDCQAIEVQQPAIAALIRQWIVFI